VTAWAVVRANQGIRSGVATNGGGVMWIDGFYVVRSMATRALTYWDKTDPEFTHVLIEVQWPAEPDV
jgi:hypothetical protein